MYINKTCPFNNHQNHAVMNQPSACTEVLCRFHIEGICAIIGSFEIAQENNALLSRIAQALNVQKF